MGMGENVGRVDHVVMMVWPENLESCVRRLEEIFETEFQYFEADRQGIKGALSDETLLEVIAPLRDGSPASESLERLLDQKGEGVHSITFGVADAHATRKRLDALGVKNRGVFDALHEDAPQFIKDDYSVLQECHLRERVHGTLFVLSQIERSETGGE
ncbi:MAG: hypothetical protein J4G09_09630 [Proteobacteria bacterium]|nr:hypothetical protein [Pseudomonadota bacterium]